VVAPWRAAPGPRGRAAPPTGNGPGAAARIWQSFAALPQDLGYADCPGALTDTQGALTMTLHRPDRAATARGGERWRRPAGPVWAAGGFGFLACAAARL
jgi:hypothetical protein